jgi:zinc protease
MISKTLIGIFALAAAGWTQTPPPTTTHPALPPQNAPAQPAPVQKPPVQTAPAPVPAPAAQTAAPAQPETPKPATPPVFVPLVPKAPAPPAGPASAVGLKFPPLREIQPPKIEKVTLSNGMKVLLVESHELPTVRGVAMVRTGNLFDPADKVGLASVTGAAIRSGGTKGKTGEELDEQLENIAATVESGIGESYGTVSFSCLRENTAEVVAVFAGILTAPEFRDEKIDFEKSQLRSGITRRNDEYSAISKREFTALLFGRDTSYGWNIEYQTLDRIQRADVLAFYKRYFFPSNVTLGVIGDFDPADMKSLLERTFSGWTVTQPEVPPFPDTKKTPTPGAFVAVKTGGNQTSFAVGELGGKLNDPDYPALDVMAGILGGGFQSRLFREVRSKQGFVYSISAEWSPGYNQPGIFQISGSTKSGSTVATFKSILVELQKMRTEEVTPAELETAKQTVLNGFIFHFDSPAKTLNRLLLDTYFNYPSDFLFRYQKAVAAVTAADVVRVSRKYLKLDDLTWLAVGNPKEFIAPLDSFGLPVKEIDIKIPEPKDSDFSNNPANQATGKALLKKVQQALGGVEKLSAISDLTIKNITQLDPSAGGLRAEQINQWLTPKYFRQEAKYPFGTVSVYFDGKAGWINSAQATVPLPEMQRLQMSSELFRTWVPLMLSDRDSDRKVVLVADGLIEISDGSGNSVRIAIDPTTNLPTKEEYQIKQPNGPAASLATTLADFQPVAGVLFPRKMTLLQSGKKAADVTVADIQVNTGLKANLLGRQP